MNGSAAGAASRAVSEVPVYVGKDERLVPSPGSTTHPGPVPSVAAAAVDLEDQPFPPLPRGHFRSLRIPRARPSWATGSDASGLGQEGQQSIKLFIAVPPADLTPRPSVMARKLLQPG